MKRKSLSTVVFEGLLDQIRSGNLGPGAQLPTEADLCDSFSVSRTVVREAIARLRSEGLVIPRQGKGVFVSEAPLGSFSIPDQDLDALPQMLALLELRLGVEVESAGLCASRCTEDEARAIRAEMERVDAAHPDPTSTEVHYDHAFHLLIARGSHNPQIIDFLAYLGQQIGPRLRLGYILLPSLKEEYFDRIHGEHRAVVEAIERRNPDHAREAMRTHLSNSLERLRALAKATGMTQRAGRAAE